MLLEVLRVLVEQPAQVTVVLSPRLGEMFLIQPKIPEI